MEYFINNSIILNFIYRMLTFIYTKFKESAIYNLFSLCSEKIKLYFSYSKIWNYLTRPDMFDLLWINSFIYSILNKILNWPSLSLRKFYLKHEEVFLHSYGFRFVNWLIEDFHSIIGIALICTFIVPDHKWYNIYGVIIVLMLTILFFIRTITKPHALIDIKNIDFTLIIFMMVMGISTFTSLFPQDSINYFIYYFISLITIIIIVSSISSVEDITKIVELIVVGAFITALYGIYQWKIVGIAVNPSLTDITVNQGMSGRVFSTMGNPNIYGEFLVLTLPLFGSIIIGSESWWKKGIYAVMILPVILILFLTGSRSAWVSFAFAIFIFVFFTNRKLLPFMILVGLLAIPALPQSIYRRILTIFNPNDSSLQYRKQILEPAMPMLRDYWLGGVGLGNQVFNTIYKRYKSFSLKTVAHTHNLYLQLWLETGILGVLSLLWLLFRLFKKSCNAIFTQNNPRIKTILIGCISSISGILVMGFADHTWFYNRILFLFWVVIALTFSALKLLNQEDRVGGN